MIREVLRLAESPWATGCLFLVLSEAELCEIPTVQALLQGIIDSHLNYALSLQEDRDPQPAVQEESQDEYGQFDLNWDDPRVLAALDSTTELPAAVTTMQYTYQSIVEVRRREFQLCAQGTPDRLYNDNSISKVWLRPRSSII